MLHHVAEVLAFRDYRGQVRVQGEIWRAVSGDDLHTGDRAEVLSIEVLSIEDGLTLRVRRCGKPWNGDPADEEARDQESALMGG